MVFQNHEIDLDAPEVRIAELGQRGLVCRGVAGGSRFENRLGRYEGLGIRDVDQRDFAAIRSRLLRDLLESGERDFGEVDTRENVLCRHGRNLSSFQNAGHANALPNRLGDRAVPRHRGTRLQQIEQCAFVDRGHRDERRDRAPCVATVEGRDLLPYSFVRSASLLQSGQRRVRASRVHGQPRLPVRVQVRLLEERLQIGTAYRVSTAYIAQCSHVSGANIGNSPVSTANIECEMAHSAC